ncbi:uncharacterized protein LOC135138339 [Zophobas morio]|uniref:uncharacterized protein LOC135138339 n=1 Tax=Zophobas morio TaxID=2755281 RepID=UPI003083AC70
METTAKSTDIHQEDNSSENSASMFKKRPGTTDHDKHIYIANLLLKLTIDDDVENFHLSWNDEEFGSFENVAVEIFFKNRTETFAFQLKHVAGKTAMIEKLNSPNEETSEENSEKFEFFFKNVYLCNDQPDVEQLKKEVLETLEAHFCCNETVFRDYIDFITQWSMKQERQFKLDKTWMKHVIALCVCSPLTKSLSFLAGKSVDDKEQIFREAVSKCDLTVIGNDNFERIESIWSDAIDGIDDMEKTSKINNLYQIMENLITSKEMLYAEDASKVSKLMWLLGKTPLIVTGCPQVYQALKTCQIRNLIVLDNQETFSKGVEGITNSQQKTFLFRKLFELKEHTKLYHDILMKFTYSLEGQREIELKFLQEVCDIDNFITTDDLIEMLKAPLLIGNPEALPPSHIERKLTKTLIDVKFLETIDENTVALIDCMTDVNFFQRNFRDAFICKINEVDSIQNIHHSQKIYVCENQVSQEEFTSLCWKNPGTQFQHFKYVDNHLLEWVGSGNYDPKCGYLKQLENFRLRSEFMEHDIDERQYFSESRQNVNIICAGPGAGKSTLMKSLKSRTSSSKWVVLINAQDLGKVASDVDILEVTCQKCSKLLDQIVFKTMLEQNQIEVVWDGLDEASDSIQATIVALVKALSQRGVKQWLTSRNNLKNVLEENLGTFSRSVKQFSDDEQRNYIKSRLQVPEDELSEIFSKIKENITTFPNYEILGIPLQLYMLTELFLKDQKKYLLLLDDIFTVLDLYRHFVTTTNDFSHSSFGEYFAAVYLFEHEMSKSLDKKFISDSRNTNTRFFLDLMLTENRKVFLAVLYKNPSILGELTDADLEQKDAIGRNVLEVACAWTRNYPVVTNETLLVNFGFNKKWIINNDHAKVAQDLNHRDLKSKFDQFSNTCFKKLLLFLPFLIPLYDGNQFGDDYLATVLYYAIRFDYSVIFECIENCLPLKTTYEDDINSSSVLALAIFHQSERILKLLFSEESDYFTWDWVEDLWTPEVDFDELFALVLELRKLEMDSRNWRGEFLAHFACRKNLIKTMRLLIRKGEKIDATDDDGQLPIHYACQYGDLEMIQLLVANGVSLDNPDYHDQLPMHYACKNRYSGSIIIPFLVEKGAKVDSPDRKGGQPIHFACEYGNLEEVKLLVAKGAKVDALDGDGQLPIHYACRNWLTGYRIVPFLGQAVDRPDDDVRLPIHYACEHGDLQLVKLLVANGVRVDVPDGNGKLPMHYAFKNSLSGYSIIPFLKEKGAKMDSPDGFGRLPIHCACEDEDLEEVKLLVANGAKVDALDGHGRLPIHYACKNPYSGYNIIPFLIEKGVKVDCLDGNGQLPIHYTCIYNDSKVLELLLTNGAKADVPDGNGRLPLHHACQNCSHGYQLMSLLIENGAKVDTSDEDGLLPIHYACEHGNLESVELLVANGAKVNVPDGHGHLPMHYACKNSWMRDSIISFLTTQGAKVDIPNDDGRLPIHYACEGGSLDEVMLLVASGAKINVPDGNGRLPIHYASKNRFNGDRIIQFLIDKGAEVDAPDGDGRQPIHYACEHGDLAIVKLLVDNGAKVDVPDGDGQLPMHYASKLSHSGYTIIPFLLENGAQVDSPDGNGRLPIHYGCEHGDLEVVESLVENGAKVDVPVGTEQLPIHFACKNRYSAHPIISLLKEKGAKVDIPDGNGRLPIHYACEHCPLIVIDLLLRMSLKLDVPDGDGRLPMHYACKNCFDGRNVIPFLRENGAEMDSPDDDNRLPIHYACEHGDLNMVKLLVRGGAKVVVRDNEGRLPVDYARKNETFAEEIVTFLTRQSENR